MQFFVNRESRVSFLTQKEMVFLTLLLMYFVGNLLCIVWINVDNIYKTCYCFISLLIWRDQHYYIIKPIFGSRNHYTLELHHYALWNWTSVLKVSSKRPDLFTQIAEALCYKRIELYMCYCLRSLHCWQQESSSLYQYTFAIGDYNWCLKKIVGVEGLFRGPFEKCRVYFPFYRTYIKHTYSDINEHIKKCVQSSHKVKGCYEMKVHIILSFDNIGKQV